MEAFCYKVRQRELVTRILIFSGPHDLPMRVTRDANSDKLQISLRFASNNSNFPPVWCRWLFMWSLNVWTYVVTCTIWCFKNIKCKWSFNFSVHVLTVGARDFMRGFIRECVGPRSIPPLIPGVQCLLSKTTQLGSYNFSQTKFKDSLRTNHGFQGLKFNLCNKSAFFDPLLNALYGLNT